MKNLDILLGMIGPKGKQSKGTYRNNALTVVDGTLNVNGSITANGNNICSMKDRKKLEPMLRAFKNGDIDLEYAVNFILDLFSISKRFNSNSFLIGIFVGSVIALIYLHFAL